MWFEKLTGFKEESAENVKNKIKVCGEYLVINSDLKIKHGTLEISSLKELKEKSNLSKYNSKIKIEEIVADVKELHCDVKNANALFQSASQFNLLEMVSPRITPEQGISRYEFDNTQGPACAISCGAGTIYRNYFVNIKDQIGQTEHNQIDCLELIAKELNNEVLNLWTMKNGYALLNQNGLLSINKTIKNFTSEERENLKEKLKTGIQWNTEVTLSKTRHKVSQIYCSALPVAYSQIDSYYWEPFARLILEALYESTLYTGVLNMEKNNSNTIYLTLVGGGAFGNEEDWILESLEKVLLKFKNVPLNIKIVSHRKSNPDLIKSIDKITTDNNIA